MPFPLRRPLLALLLAAHLSAFRGRAEAAQAPLPAEPGAAPCGPVVPGAFAQDVGSALRRSEETGLPLLLAFTGNDWSDHCRRLRDEVFSREEWTAWAASNLVLAAVDFPKDASALPEEVRDRNRSLAERFSLEALPSFVLLAPGAEGADVLARFGAEDALCGAGAFLDSIRVALRPLDPAALAERLSDEERAEFGELRARLRECRALLEKARRELDAEAAAWAERIDRARAESPDAAAALQREAAKALVPLAERIRTATAALKEFPGDRYAELLEKLKSR